MYNKEELDHLFNKFHKITTNLEPKEIKALLKTYKKTVEVYAINIEEDPFLIKEERMLMRQFIQLVNPIKASQRKDVIVKKLSQIALILFMLQSTKEEKERKIHCN